MTLRRGSEPFAEPGASLMTYESAVQYLYDLRWFGAKLGLENTHRLAALAGNPQERLRFIHVAGTNGKGSTCAMLESIYRWAGLRVGLFTSPHLVHFSERIQVNREPIPERDVVRLVEGMRPLVEQFGRDHHPTFFEVATVMALSYFAEKACDVVVWETGLGGRLDATNIVHPLASVITTIEFDHEKWLGSTLASIALEKAGIIKPGVPVVTGVADTEPLEVIRQTAATRQSPLHLVPLSGPEPSPLDGIELPLHGAHQRANARVALRTVEVLGSALPVSPDAVVRGFESVYWPARLQRIVRENGQVVVLDAAHNPSGAATLASAIRAEFAGARTCFILGILQDKNYREMCKLLAPLAGRILIAPVHSDRAATGAELAAACAAAKPGVSVRECPSLAEALAATAPDETVVIAGSLYLAGEAMEILGISNGGRKQERGLNEYGQYPKHTAR